MTHIYSHAFTESGELLGDDYNPFPDYIIHGLQCLTIAQYHPKLTPITMAMCLVVMYGGYMVGLVDTGFCDTHPMTWIFISGMGVVGTHYQMLMLEDPKCRSMEFYFQCAMIWMSVFAGYMFPFLADQETTEDRLGPIIWWDGVMQYFAIFRIGMIAFGLAVALQRFLDGPKSARKTRLPVPRASGWFLERLQ